MRVVGVEEEGVGVVVVGEGQPRQLVGGGEEMNCPHEVSRLNLYPMIAAERCVALTVSY